MLSTGGGWSLRFERGHNFAKQVQMEERYPHQGIRVSSVHITVCMWDAAARLSWRGGDDDQKALALRSRALRASASAKRSDVTRKLGPVEWCKWRGSKGRYSLKLAPHPSLGPYGNVSSAKHPGGPRTEVNIAAARATNPRILTVTAVKMHCRTFRYPVPVAKKQRLDSHPVAVALGTGPPQQLRIGSHGLWDCTCLRDRP